MKNLSLIKSSLLIFIISAFIASSSISAQPQQRPPKVPDAKEITNMVKNLSKELSLSSKQQQEIKSLFTNHFADLKDRMEAKRNEHDAERQKIDNHKKQFESEINKVLNDEQQELFVEFMKNNHKQNKEKPRR